MSAGQSQGKVLAQDRVNSGGPHRPMDAQSTAPRLLTLQQAAEYLAVSYWTVRSWVEAGRLAAVRLPGDGRLLRIERAALDRLIESSRV